jgi:hypothetical protein
LGWSLIDYLLFPEELPDGKRGFFDQGAAPRAVPREPIHLESVDGATRLEVSIPYADEPIGVPGGLKDAPGRFDVPTVEELIPLAVKPDAFVARQLRRRVVGGLYEPPFRETFENPQIHFDGRSAQYTKGRSF